MRWKHSLVVVPFLSALLLATGCDFSTSSSNVEPPIVCEGAGCPPPGEQPLLVSVEPDNLQVCVGTEITLFGFNFAEDLRSNEVTFVAGVTRVTGDPVAVEVPGTSTA